MAEPTSEEIAAFAAAAGVDQTQDAEPVEDADTSQEAPPDFYLGTYRDRESAEYGIAEKDRLIAERAEEVGQLRRELEDARREREYFQQPQPQAPVDEGPHNLTQAELMQVNQQIQGLKAEGRTDEALELQLNLNEVIHQRERFEERQEFEARLARLEAPLVEMRNDKIAASAVEGAKALLGADADQILYEYRDVVIDAANTNPQILGQEGGIRAEQIARLVLGEKALRERQGTTPPRNDQGQFVPVSGGSGAEPSQDTLPQADTLEPGDPRLAFAQQVKKDAFGTIPSFAGQ